MKELSPPCNPSFEEHKGLMSKLLPTTVLSRLDVRSWGEKFSRTQLVSISLGSYKLAPALCWVIGQESASAQERKTLGNGSRPVDHRQGREKECWSLLHPTAKCELSTSLCENSVAGAQTCDGLQLCSRSFISSCIFLLGESLPATVLTLSPVCISGVAGFCCSYICWVTGHTPCLVWSGTELGLRIVGLWFWYTHFCCVCILVALGNIYFSWGLYFRYTILVVLYKTRNWIHLIFWAKLPR